MRKVVIFEIRGPAAHFRKFYTNSSSLSYAFPPRTTLAGIVAAVLGLPKDSYYSLLTGKEAHYALRLMTPVRKIMQTVKFVRTKTIKEVNGSGGPTMIPTEIILPVRGRELFYRVYFYHDDPDFQEELAKQLALGPKFPVYLGRSEFLAKINFLGVFPGTALETNFVDTVVNLQLLNDEELLFSTPAGEDLRYLKEKMPFSFNPDRSIASISSVVYEINGKRVGGRFKVPAFQIDSLGDVVLFLEPGGM